MSTKREEANWGSFLQGKCGKIMRWQLWHSGLVVRFQMLDVPLTSSWQIAEVRHCAHCKNRGVKYIPLEYDGHPNQLSYHWYELLSV